MGVDGNIESPSSPHLPLRVGGITKAKFSTLNRCPPSGAEMRRRGEHVELGGSLSAQGTQSVENIVPENHLVLFSVLFTSKSYH